MNRFAYRTTGLAVKALAGLSKARINIPDISNDCIKGKPIPLDVFDKANSLCLNPDQDSIYYSIFQTVSPYVVGRIDSFCNADTLSFVIYPTIGSPGTGLQPWPICVNKLPIPCIWISPVPLDFLDRLLTWIASVFESFGLTRDLMTFKT